MSSLNSQKNSGKCHSLNFQIDSRNGNLIDAEMMQKRERGTLSVIVKQSLKIVDKMKNTQYFVVEDEWGLRGQRKENRGK